MKLITRNVDYALRALSYLAQNRSRVVRTDELVSELEIPRPFLRRILQKLNSRGILKSNKGRSGGFVLRKSPGDIKLISVMGIFQGGFRLNECVLKKKLCPNIRICRLKKRIDGLEAYMLKEIKKISLAHLIKE